MAKQSHPKSNIDLVKNNPNCFNFIRCFLAFVVLISHFFLLADKKELLKFDTTWAVSAFFVISGFFSFLSFQRNPSFKPFIKKRLLRIYPSYATVVVFSIVVGLFITDLPATKYLTDPQTLEYFVANTFFLNFLKPDLPGVFTGNALSAVNGSLWFLKVLIFLYLTVPIVYYLLKRYNKVAVLLCIFSLSIAYKMFFFHLFENTGNFFYYSMSKQFGTQLIYFYGGITIFLYFNYLFKYLKILLPLSILLYFACYRIPVMNVFLPFAFTLIIISCGYCLKFLNCFNKYPDLSYGIFLFHFPAIQLFVYFRNIYGYDIFPPLLVFSIIATVVASYLTLKFIEKPIYYLLLQQNKDMRGLLHPTKKWNGFSKKLQTDLFLDSHL